MYRKSTDLPPKWYVTDNGFRTELHMDRSQQPIVELARGILSKVAGSALDLGCGNCALLKKLVALVPGTTAYGVELDPLKVEHARSVLPEARIFQGSIGQSDAPWLRGHIYHLVILMPGRLMEFDDAKSERLRNRLSKYAKNILLYAYEDWIHRHGDIERLISKANLRVESVIGRASNALCNAVAYQPSRVDGA